MDLLYIKGFLKKYFFDFFFYTYLFKLSFLTVIHTKAEIYIGTLLSFIMLCNKFLELKDDEFKEEIELINKKILTLSNSLNGLSLKIEKVRKFVDTAGTRQTFESIKNPFNLRNK
ncbi:MAG TPA: hypothetical protein DCS66_04900 [Flavobacteriaceae bacterium]|nr:hypothetical protein [Spongiibacteraceae bacterium]HAT63927.1 hypothetical protein [Flavobacteriaceae bacterium]